MGLVDPYGIVEDLEGDGGPVPADEEEVAFAVDGSAVVSKTDVGVAVGVGKVEEGDLVGGAGVGGEIDGGEVGVVVCGEAEYEKPDFDGEDGERAGLDGDLDADGDAVEGAGERGSAERQRQGKRRTGKISCGRVETTGGIW